MSAQLAFLLHYEIQIVSCEKRSDLQINISAQPLVEQVDNMEFDEFWQAGALAPPHLDGKKQLLLRSPQETDVFL